MTRIALDDGGWYDSDKAVVIADERTRWDGNNHISLATGSQWVHEQIIRTAKGAWVLHHWSQWQGSKPSYRVVSAEEAARWILQYGDAELPEELAAHAEAGEV